MLRVREADPFEMTDVGHRYLISIHDFPLAAEGTHLLQLFLREHDADATWRKVAEYPMEIAHTGVVGE